ncbi:MAG TPA: hypothetical protein DEA88_02525 [Erwinia persicina]|nr:hypothetical protein [Erwinia persicina]HBH67900.1 hypothetical protein [Erwinia persicina]HBI08455.1 hypothetical protein [Erwinia persicina]HBT12037.1 hypothetical protein [Erwinia persicina]HBT30871.1 hypothetical protein [Erwinia persicina]
MFRFTSGFEQAENGKILTQLARDHETLRLPERQVSGTAALAAPIRLTSRRYRRPAARSPLLRCAAGKSL